MVGLPAAYAEIQLEETYYYDLGDTLTFNGKLIGHDTILFKENGYEYEPVKIDIYDPQQVNPFVFEIRIFPDCSNECTFNNSLSLSREVGFREGVYNATISYGKDRTSYEFGVGVHSIEALKSMNFENVGNEQISIFLDKEGYQLGDTVHITAFTNFGFKKVLTATIGQVDSPIYDSARYGSKDISLQYHQYNSTFTVDYKVGENDKRLGHYYVTVFDNLDSVTKYFKVSENGLEIIPREPTLNFNNPYVHYGEYLYFDGYMKNTFDARYDLAQSMFDTGRNNSENKRMAGNNVKIELNYESDDYKIIGNEIYINMNELGYFSGSISITRNIPNLEIISVTASTMSQSTTNEFIILADESNRLVYYDDIFDCDAQKEFIESHKNEYQSILQNVDLLTGYNQEIELKRAENYKTEYLDPYQYTSNCS